MRSDLLQIELWGKVPDETRRSNMLCTASFYSRWLVHPCVLLYALHTLSNISGDPFVSPSSSR
jgi:hypothetical protein